MKAVEMHYTKGDILDSIKNGLAAAGKDASDITVDDLSAVDEFHIGGRIASKHFFPKLGFETGQYILDVGAGIGGGARFAADSYGVRVTGIDLTEEYVAAGNEMSRWVGMSEAVELRVGNATALDLPDAGFDGAFTMHVFMNVEDKSRAFSEVYRVLKPGAVFGIYDVTKYGESPVQYPVPWADEPATSFLSSAGEYVAALEGAGFRFEWIENRHEFAVSYFNRVMEKMEAGGPPPLGIHLLMGDNAREKLVNITANLNSGAVAPFEIVARKPS